MKKRLAEGIDSFVEFAKALADQQRVRALLALRDRELCACQIIELLGLAPSTVSRHMTVLKSAGLIRSRKEGRWTFYRLTDSETSPHVRETLTRIMSSLANDPQITKDDKRLRKILALPQRQMCRKHTRRYERAVSVYR